MDTEHYSQQYFLRLAAAALSSPLLSHECLNFILRGCTVLGALRVKVLRNTGEIGGWCGMLRQEGPGWVKHGGCTTAGHTDTILVLPHGWASPPVPLETPVKSPKGTQ